MQNPTQSFIPILILCFIAHSVTLAQNESEPSASSASAHLKSLSIEELLNVEVTTVSRRPEKLTEVASAIQVITNDEIRNSGATNLPEALRLATNLQVAQVNSSQWAISARGFNNVLANKLLVMIDGRTVYTPLYAGVFWDVQHILLQDIDRIEVVSGPGGTLWGSNAVNGVINIITKTPEDRQGTLVEAGFGSELQAYGGLRHGGKLGNDIYYSLYATGFRRGSLQNSEGSDASDEWSMAQGGFQLDWDATEKDKLRFLSNVYDTRPNPESNDLAIKARGQNALARWTHVHSENSDFQLQIYYDRTWRDFRNGFTEGLNTYDLDGQHRFQLSKSQEIVWGLGFRLMDHKVENLALFRFVPPEKNLTLYNMFIQDRIALIKDRLELTLGLKAEHNSYTGIQYQPSARIAITLARNHLLWGAVSRAVRTPARIDRDFYLDATPEIPLITGNKSFESESLIAYEIGWRVQSESKFNVALSTFYNRYNDLRSAEPGPPPFFIPVTFGNGVEGETYGAELSGTLQALDWLQFDGGYTFLKKELHVKSTSNDLNGGDVESNDPQHQFLIQTIFKPAKKIEASFVTRFVDELPDPRIPGYWELDARMSWRPNEKLEFSIVGQNLLNKEHLEFIPSSPLPRYVERGIYAKGVFRF